MKISVKFLLIILLVTLSLGITALSGVLFSSRMLEQEINGKYMAVSTYAMEKVHRFFARRFDDMQMLSREAVLVSRESSPVAINDVLQAYKKHFRSYVPYASLSFYDLNRTRIADSEARGIGVQEAPRGYWRQLTQGADRALDVAVSELTGKPVFRLAEVVRDKQGAPQGVVTARIAVESLDRLVEHPLKLFRLGLTPDVDLIDRTGRILYSTRDKAAILKQTLPAFARIKNSMAGGETTGTELLDAAGRGKSRQILVFSQETADAKYQGNGWVLTISIPERLALATLVGLRDKLIFIICVIGGLSAVIAVMLSKAITQPLALLSEASAAVGEGKLDIAVEVKSRDEIGSLAATFNHMVRRLAALNNELRIAATVDKLTGVLNRHRIEQVLSNEMERSSRYDSPLSLILCDVDHFKQVNDTLGHLAGDGVLKKIAAVMQENIRATDSLGRWGGEEFIILVPGTEAKSAALLAEKIRSSIERTDCGAACGVTLSCGVAAMDAGDDADSLLKRADDALYAAKAGGRNLVMLGAPAASSEAMVRYSSC